MAMSMLPGAPPCHLDLASYVSLTAPLQLEYREPAEPSARSLAELVAAGKRHPWWTLTGIRDVKGLVKMRGSEWSGSSKASKRLRNSRDSHERQRRGVGKK